MDARPWGLFAGDIRDDGLASNLRCKGGHPGYQLGVSAGIELGGHGLQGLVADGGQHPLVEILAGGSGAGEGLRFVQQVCRKIELGQLANAEINPGFALRPI